MSNNKYDRFLKCFPEDQFPIDREEFTCLCEVEAGIKKDYIPQYISMARKNGYIIETVRDRGRVTHYRLANPEHSNNEEENEDDC